MNLESGENATSGGSKASSPMKKRGPTRGIGLEKFVKSKQGKKLVINVSPTKGRPTNGIESAKLSSEIGMQVRHHLPKKTSFKDIPKASIDASIRSIGARFEIDVDQTHVSRVIKGIMKDRSRGEKHKLCRLFHTYPSAEEARKEVPANVDEADWNELIDYWTSPKFQRRSETNKKNRGHKPIHSGGSKPFVVHHEEKGDPIEGFKETHTKNGSNEEWLAPEFSENYEKMKALVAERISDLENESEDLDPKLKKDIVTEVLGSKPGRLLGFGFGPVPDKCSKASGSKDSEMATQLEESRARNEELHTQNQDLQATIHNQDERINNLEETLKALASIPELGRLISGTLPK